MELTTIGWVDITFEEQRQIYEHGSARDGDSNV